MSFVSIVIYNCFLGGTSAWIYHLVYNKDLIQKYSQHGSNIPQNSINEYLDRNLRHIYHLNILDVNTIEDDMELEELKHGQQRAPNHQLLNGFYTKAAIKPDTPLNENQRLRQMITGILFSFTIALSLGLVFVLMCELGDFLSVESRLSLFKLTIDTLMLLLVCVLPLACINLVISKDLVLKDLKFTTVAVSICSYAVWFVILHKCGDLTQDFNPKKFSQEEQYTRNLMERKINEVSIVGITILAILSGAGSASTPYRVISMDSLKKLTNYKGANSSTLQTSSNSSEGIERDINLAIRNYNNTTLLLSKREQELAKLQATVGGTIYNLPNQNTSSDNVLISKGNTGGKKLGSIIHKVQSFANLSLQGQSEETQLQQEIASLKSLKKGLYNDLTNLVQKSLVKLENLSSSGISTQKILFSANVVLATYCVYRIFNVFLIKLPLLYLNSKNNDEQVADSQIIEVAQEAPSAKDALAITIAKVIVSMFRDLPISETQLVNQLSFILSGSLFCCSFSNVVTTFKSFSRIFQSNLREFEIAKTWLKHLVVAELFGVYVLATALLIRTNLPETLSNQVSTMLSLSGSAATNSLKEVMFVDTWFDKVFAVSCLITMVVIFIRKYVDDDDLLASDGFYDEESTLESNELKLA